ncbi:hypothetical protein BDV96DRAFT_600901 [Lophiotrema nucula]|uniref:Uncharacterized protein n=1 Tax=Lophiotrema nucula TaxID=690887 RepID=A0A6A5Z3Y1_9PLEO|nr:hypothetical protein BDV96DRAFT_600901 [Lophiotrema nucula]
MASSSTSVPPQGGDKPSKNVLSELFRTGFLANVTLYFGKGHTFKVYRDVLIEKSRWFAKHLSGKSEFHIYVPLAHFEERGQSTTHLACECDPSLAHENSQDGRCRVSMAFYQLLRYCYTEEYPDFSSWRNSFRIAQDGVV